MSLKIAAIKNIRIEMDSTFFVVLLFAFFTGYLTEFVLCLLCMALHELAHVFAATAVNARVYSVKLLPFGFKAVIEDDFCKPSAKAAIYISGPMINLVLFSALHAVSTYFLIDSENMRFFILTNLLLAIFNMIPLLPLDGGRLLRLVLSGRVGLFAAADYLYNTSLFLSAALIIAGFIFLFGESHNFSLLCIGLYIFFILKSGKTEAAFMNVKHVIYRRSRLLKRGIYPARDLVVIQSVHLVEILNNLDFDRFHIIYVLDDDLKICATFTEQQIIDYILKYDNDMTFGDLIHINSDSDPLL